MERPSRYARLITLTASVSAIAVLYLARGVLVPFALAMLVSFLLAPFVRRLQRWRLSRVAAVVTAVLLVGLAASSAGWLLVCQVREVTTRLSEYKANLQEKVLTLRGAVAQPVQAALKTVMDLGTELTPALESASPAAAIQTVRIAEAESGPLQVLRDAFGPTLEILTMAAMALLFAFVMLLRRDDLGDRFMRLVGHGKILVTTRALEEAAQKISRYLWRLVLLNGLHGLAVGLGLTWIGVPNALLWGILAAILRFIPYLGPWIAATFPVLVALAVAPGWSQPLLTIGWFALLELVSNNLLEPWIYGTGTGISPLAILVSALFWTWLWGPVGLVLSTPLTVCLVVMGKYVPQLRFLQLLFGDAPGLSPPERFYQRLIVGDQDQAWSVLHAELQRSPLLAVYDSVVLPALSMAEDDRQRGSLDDEAEARIAETLRLLLEEAGEQREGPGAGAESVRAAHAQPLRVLCIPARGAFDALAATLLCQVLERDGIQVEVSSIAILAGEALDRLAEHAVDIVCISAVPPSRFMHVRYLCKRLARRFPELPIVAGMWTLELDSQELAERLPILAGTHVVASLSAARLRVRELAESVRTCRAPELAPALVGVR